jgi:hypothetical protein
MLLAQVNPKSLCVEDGITSNEAKNKPDHSPGSSPTPRARIVTPATAKQVVAVGQLTPWRVLPWDRGSAIPRCHRQY